MGIEHLSDSYKKAYDRRAKQRREKAAARKTAERLVKKFNEEIRSGGSGSKTKQAIFEEHPELEAVDKAGRHGGSSNVNVPPRTPSPQESSVPSSAMTTSQRISQELTTPAPPSSIGAGQDWRHTFTEVPRTKYVAASNPITFVDKNYEKFETDLSVAEEKLIWQQQQKEQKKKQTYVEGAKLFGLGVVSGVYHTAKVVVRPDIFVKDVWGAATQKNGVWTIGANIGTQIKTNPSGLLGELAGSVGVIKGTGSLFRAGKQVYIAAGTKYIKPEKVFSSQVLNEGKTLPTVTSTDETIAQVRKAGDVVVSTSPQKISGTSAQVGKKATTGFEDTGIYAGAKGEASPYFLRLDKSKLEYGFNPIDSFKDLFKIPTATEFQATGVGRYPRSVVKPAGFDTVKVYQEAQAGSGKVFVTKRSEIGQGELTAQYYKDSSGRLVREAGTTEGEVIIPVGQEFVYTPSTAIGKIKGFDYYTKYEGSRVAIRPTELVVTDTGTGATTKFVSSVPSYAPTTVSRYQVLSEQSYLSSAPTRMSPTPFVAASSISRGTMTDPLISGGGEVSTTTSVGFSSKPPIPKSPPPSLVPSKELVNKEPYYTPTIKPSSGGGGSSRGSSGGGSSGGSSGGGSSGGGSSGGSSGGGSSGGGSSGGSSGGGSSGGGSSGGSSGGGSSYYTPTGSSYYTPTYSYKTPPPPTTYISPFKYDTFNKRGGLNVFVRRFGKFRKVNVQPLNRFAATQLGKKHLRHTAAASFKIKGFGGETYTPTSLSKGFRFSTKEKGVIIQRRSFRIGTSGEKREITFKGIQASKLKAAKKKKRRGLFSL